MMTNMEKTVWAAAFAMRKGVGVTPENAAAFACITVKQMREMNTGLLCRTEWIREMLQEVFGRELVAADLPTIEPDAMSPHTPPIPPLPLPPPLPRVEPPEPPTLPPPKKEPPPKRKLRW